MPLTFQLVTVGSLALHDESGFGSAAADRVEQQGAVDAGDADSRDLLRAETLSRCPLPASIDIR